MPVGGTSENLSFQCGPFRGLGSALSFGMTLLKSGPEIGISTKENISFAEGIPGPPVGNLCGFPISGFPSRKAYGFRHRFPPQVPLQGPRRFSYGGVPYGFPR